jgi:hypothetical protein
MARSPSSFSKNFGQGMLGEGTQSLQPSSKVPGLVLVNPTVQIAHEAQSAASILSPPKSHYAIFLQSQSPKIRDGKEIVEVRKQRLLETKVMNFTGPQETMLSASTIFTSSTSPSKDVSTFKVTSVAGSDSCNIKMGDSRVFAGSNL